LECLGMGIDRAVVGYNIQDGVGSLMLVLSFSPSHSSLVLTHLFYVLSPD
jgi:hypothetical protein